jgi:hypothetical protein
MLFKILRKVIQNVDSLYTHGYIDHRGLQPYPKSTLHKTKQNKN